VEKLKKALNLEVIKREDDRKEQSTKQEKLDLLHAGKLAKLQSQIELLQLEVQRVEGPVNEQLNAIAADLKRTVEETKRKDQQIAACNLALIKTKQEHERMEQKLSATLNDLQKERQIAYRLQRSSEEETALLIGKHDQVVNDQLLKWTEERTNIQKEKEHMMIALCAAEARKDELQIEVRMFQHAVSGL
jgi:hypothetical protein